MISFVDEENFGTYTKNHSLWENAENELYEILDADHTEKQTTSALKKLLETYPDFIEGHAQLGLYYFHFGKPKLALAACLKGMDRCDRLIPTSFTKDINLGDVEYVYIQLAHCAALCHLQLRQHKKAAQMLEHLLKLDPRDGQGARFLLGPIYVRLLRFDEALAILDAESDGFYPPNQYEIGLIHIMAQNWEKAVHSLRLGFVTNPYIAELICGNPFPQALAVRHGSNLNEPEIAMQYWQFNGDFWEQTPIACRFVHWLFNHPQIMIERAHILYCDGEMLWQNDPVRYRELRRKKDAMVREVSQSSSESFVKKRKDENGNIIHPWEHPEIAYNF